MKRVAVVLCGSGYKDGSEIRESVGVLWALAAEKAAVKIFAPDEPQSDVVNCLTGTEAKGEKRNQLVEAARIARGDIRPLSQLQPSEFDALIMPGGFGAAKNLCNFARAGSGGKVHEGLLAILREFHAASKPLGAVCIAPAILALAFPRTGLELTVGAASEASGEIEKLGHRHVVKTAAEWHVDRQHRVVTTPAYMYDSAPLDHIFTGIRGLVASVCQMA